MFRVARSPEDCRSTGACPLCLDIGLPISRVYGPELRGCWSSRHREQPPCYGQHSLTPTFEQLHAGLELLKDQVLDDSSAESVNGNSDPYLAIGLTDPGFYIPPSSLRYEVALDAVFHFNWADRRRPRSASPGRG